MTNRFEFCFLCLVSVVVECSEIITRLYVVTAPAKHVLSTHTLSRVWRTATERERERHTHRCQLAMLLVLIE